MAAEKIFYLAFDRPVPTGGEISTYEHVDLLNASGFDASVLHTRPGYRHAWFDNTTRVIPFASFWRVYDPQRDYLVLPEPLGPRTAMFPGRKVIFSKNLYYGFDAFEMRPESSQAYVDGSVVAVLANSAHNVNHLRFGFPDLPVFLMYPRVDPDVFRYRPLADKKRRICVVAKAEPQLKVLYHMLWARAAAGRNALASFEWVVLEGRSRREVAALLQDALMLVSLSTEEGLPRTVLEAMACGCLVIGVGAGALKECLPARSQCEPHDFIAMAREIESIVGGFPANAPLLAAWSDAGRDIARRFTKERQTEHLVGAWRAILAEGGARGRASASEFDDTAAAVSGSPTVAGANSSKE